MAPGDDNDSGMESQEGSVRDGQDTDTAVSGGAKSIATSSAAGEDKSGRDDDDADETLSERLWGLTEMFPESVRNTTYTAAVTTKSTIEKFYGFSRSAFWVVFSSSIILFAPVIFEVERVQMEEAQRTQQKQMLLGPNTAVAGGGMPLMPPLHR